MLETAAILRYAARILTERGLHTGDQFAAPDGSLDICAAIYVAAHGKELKVFAFDEDYSIGFIECSAPAMAAIRAMSDHLDSAPCFTPIAPGVVVSDYIEHVSNWAATIPVFGTRLLTTDEVIGRILRTADTLDAATALAA
ncbi:MULTISPECIES: hypothetical protein [Streptomyces]|uniref:DUF6197 family protein n=1 Tax=Streptomyces TaxID=1883 RepID=UPI000885AB6A|nr:MULTISPECIES: hypothetical protein [unclassified Streptomyces]PBC72331.1 hypothetical protein BX261_7415 [Streptomyces sp. 2321.6]SDR62146.1 hypothetical protein SAMN05216511_7288 [Streptomyces sp. KS_16]SEE50581.1 hypothetical protein SAMN05428940_7337 [Streptomyces sp. 2133.1]SNC77835.1 hypothetical protein SAMN06272741_7251 [Streptomyces sp. 2114.4]